MRQNLTRWAFKCNIWNKCLLHLIAFSKEATLSLHPFVAFFPPFFLFKRLKWNGTYKFCFKSQYFSRRCRDLLGAFVQVILFYMAETCPLVISGRHQRCRLASLKETPRIDRKVVFLDTEFDSHEMQFTESALRPAGKQNICNFAVRGDVNKAPVKQRTWLIG